MTHAQIGSVDLTYETFGDPSAEPLLLVMGLGGSLIWWPEDLCQQFVEAGFYVIRYDNRDAGRSTIMDGDVKLHHLARAFLGLRVAAPYSLSDLALDAVGLLDALGIERAHVVGMSMGGMIAQTIAVEHPERVLSLTSIMSTTGSKRVGRQDLAVLPAMIAKPATTEDEYADASIGLTRLVESPAHRATDAAIADAARLAWRYGLNRAGTRRQMMAVLTQPDRTANLKRLQVPALVIHGLADRMVNVSGGRATSMAIPGSELLLIKGMGHDLPEALWPTFVGAIRRTASRAALDAG